MAEASSVMSASAAKADCSASCKALRGNNCGVSARHNCCRGTVAKMRSLTARFTVSVLGAAKIAPSGPHSAISFSMSVRRTQGRAMSCTNTQSCSAALSFKLAFNAAKPFSTDCARVAPPTTERIRWSWAMSSCGHHKSASAVTTTNWLKGANDSKRDSVCSATMLPAKVRYCLGSEPPILSPLPAAGISAWRRASLGSGIGVSGVFYHQEKSFSYTHHAKVTPSNFFYCVQTRLKIIHIRRHQSITFKQQFVFRLLLRDGVFERRHMTQATLVEP